MPHIPKSISKSEKYAVYMGIVLTAMRRWIHKGGSAPRNTKKTEREYNKKWKEWSTSNYQLIGNADTRPCLLNGRVIINRQIDYRKHVLEKFADSINSIQPDSVLEIGSGNGLNLLCLALMCPTVKKWQGIELTDSGVSASKNYLKNPPVDSIAYITKAPKAGITAKIASANINYEKGDMNALPFADNAFGFVFAFHVLEQAPSTYKNVLKEVCRVTIKYAAFFEMFDDGQNVFQRLHVSNRNFFKGNSRDAEPAGFEILKFERSDLSQVAFMGCFLLCSKNQSKFNHSR